MTKRTPSTNTQSTSKSAGRPQPMPADMQEGSGRSRSRDERLKRLVRRHPQRDEPRADSVEPIERP